MDRDRISSEESEPASATRAPRGVELDDPSSPTYGVKKITLRYIGTALPLLILAIILLYMTA